MRKRSETLVSDEPTRKQEAAAPAPSTEQEISREAFGEQMEAMRAWENELGQRARHEVADALSISRTVPVPPWVRRGLALALMLSAETAMASEQSQERPGPVEVAAETVAMSAVDRKTAKTLPAMSLESARTLRQIAETAPESQTPLILTRQEKDPTTAAPYYIPEVFSADELQEKHPIVSQGTQVSIELSHQVPLSDKEIKAMTAAPDLFEIMRTARETGKRPVIWEHRSMTVTIATGIEQTHEVAHIASTTLVDSHGNDISVTRRWDDGDGIVSETILIEPSPQYAPPGQEPALVPLPIDLSALGSGKIENAFYARQRAAVGMLGEIPVYAESGLLEEEARDYFAPYADEWQAGMKQALSLFGYEKPPLYRVIIAEKVEPNAFVMLTESVLFIHDDLLRLEEPGKTLLQDLGLPITGLTDQEMETAAAHELFHLIDRDTQISADPRIEALFLRATPEVLQQLSEKNFMRQFGGHPEENPPEFIASLLNSLRDPQWEKHVAELAPPARDFYLDALKTVHRVLDDRASGMEAEPADSLTRLRLARTAEQRQRFGQELKLEAPIFTLLDQKIAALE